MATKTKNLPQRNDYSIDGMPKIVYSKTYKERFKTSVSPDFADKSTWFYNAIKVDDEVATTVDDQNYDFADGLTVINLDKITQREDYSDRGITVKVDGQITTSGYSIDYSSNQVQFTESGTRNVEVSYSYENGSTYDFTPPSGVIYKLDYSETQFTQDAQINDILVFEMILNNPSVGNQDYVVGTIEYKNGADFLNRGNHGTVMQPFGELTKVINIFPWNYLTGYTIKPVGEDCDPNNHEFNKLRVYLKNNIPYTSQIATVTFYSLEEDI